MNIKIIKRSTFNANCLSDLASQKSSANINIKVFFLILYFMAQNRWFHIYFALIR